jgi:hypothetical protein
MAAIHPVLALVAQLPILDADHRVPSKNKPSRRHEMHKAEYISEIPRFRPYTMNGTGQG